MNTLSSLWTEFADGQLGIWMSALSGVAAALAVALAMTVYFRMAYRTWRDVLRHGLAVLAALALFAFAAYDMRHAALAYLGLNPTKPAVEFEIRMPRETLTTASSDTQFELHTDRNQTLALVDGVSDLADGRALLRRIAPNSSGPGISPIASPRHLRAMSRSRMPTPSAIACFKLCFIADDARASSFRRLAGRYFAHVRISPHPGFRHASRPALSRPDRQLPPCQRAHRR